MYSIINIGIPENVDAATIQRALAAFQQALNLPQRPALKAAPAPAPLRKLRTLRIHNINNGKTIQTIGRIGNITNVVQFPSRVAN
jgi:hypothetical protein